jgi:hypothetical protein
MPSHGSITRCSDIPLDCVQSGDKVAALETLGDIFSQHAIQAQMILIIAKDTCQRCDSVKTFTSVWTALGTSPLALQWVAPDMQW